MNTIPTPQNDGLWNRVVTALSAQPAYLLVFAVCAFFFLTGIGTQVSAVMKNGDTALFALTILCFGLALGTVVIVVRQVENHYRISVPPRPIQLSVTTDDGARLLRTLASLSDDGRVLSEGLAAIASNLAASLDKKYPVLTEFVLGQCNEFRAATADWKHGQLSVAGSECNRLLIRLYEAAGSSVFCTSVSEYHTTTWETTLGQQLLDAHEHSKAEVTRVFVFNKRQEVTASMFDTMTKQSKANIKVRVYFDEEDDLFQFSADIAKDFTIIDNGDAIGVTERFDPPESRWYFADEDRRQRFLGYQEALSRGSISFQ